MTYNSNTTTKNLMMAVMALVTITASVNADHYRGLEAQCRDIALSEWPNDYEMQKYTCEKQLSAARYMASAAIIDDEVKAIALMEWPNDFEMQKYTYEKQLSAKRYMNSAAITDAECKEIALREWPSDYEMQKYS